MYASRPQDGKATTNTGCSGPAAVHRYAPRFYFRPRSACGGYELSGGFWIEAIVWEPCAGDLDGDGVTGQSDLGILLSDWGCEP